jgi:type II secretory pathway component PulF
MFFSRRLSTVDLVEFARSLRYSLSSGLMLRDTMELMATKGTRSIRPVAGKIAANLRSGWSLHEAMEKESYAFPPLFSALTNVGEETGNLPEVMHELELYYEQQIKLRKEFVSEITWPIFQFCFAILIITGLIFLLGILQPGGGHGLGEPLDPLGIGLIGTRGALIFLGSVTGIVGGVWLLFAIVRLIFRRRAWVEWMLMCAPFLGPCIYSIALLRYSVALRLMLLTNLSIMKTLRLALRATDNPVFTNASPAIEASLKRGNSIHASMAASRIFPEKYLGMLAVAEECGKIPESLQIQARELDEFTRRRLTTLNRFASWGIWLGIAVLICFAIFRIFQSVYVGQIERHLLS